MTTRARNEGPAVAGGGRTGKGAAANPSLPLQDSTVGVFCQGARVPIRVAGRVVGYVQGDAFCKTVRASIHRLRVPPAWAVDAQSLADAESLGARTVEIRDAESGCVYRADIALIRRRGFEFDRGHGVQVGLALALWDCQRPGEPAAAQLRLLGV